MQKTKEFSVLSFNLLKKILANKASAFFLNFLWLVLERTC